MPRHPPDYIGVGDEQEAKRYLVEYQMAIDPLLREARQPSEGDVLFGYTPPGLVLRVRH